MTVFRRLTLISALLFACVALGGCGSTLRKTTRSYQFLVRADDLDPKLVASAEDDTTTAADKKLALGKVIDDSALKCGAFTSTLALTQTGSNASLDAITTVFSALATAFTPVNTIHALTAGATISSGWKTALSSDIFAKASIANFAQAIQATYYRDLGQYANTLDALSGDSITTSIEITKIRTIHRECALDAAEASISATLTAATTPTAATPTGATASKVLTVSVNGSVAAGDVIQLQATSTTDPNFSAIAQYTTSGADDAVKIAAGLLAAITNSADFKKANITADPAATPPDNSLVLHFPANAGLVWSTPGSHPAELLSIADQSSKPGAPVTTNPGNPGGAVTPAAPTHH